MRQRTATLEAIGNGFGRPGYAGRWANAFGSAVVTPADGEAYRVAIETRAVYGSGDDHVRQCRVTATLKPASGGWLTGMIFLGRSQTRADINGRQRNHRRRECRTGQSLVPQDAAPGRHASRRGQRPGLVGKQPPGLRIYVAGHRELFRQRQAGNNATDKADTTFVVPTFDCTRPATASDEEICADPDLADNDQRLNRAWKTLLPRLDEVTRRALTEDQRGWLHAQATQYPEFLHPAWEKLTSFMHFLYQGRA